MAQTKKVNRSRKKPKVLAVITPLDENGQRLPISFLEIGWPAIFRKRQKLRQPKQPKAISGKEAT
ncbi:MAG: hypothetical protein Q8N16_01295 [bacterium]|nr:hypothetical protein [bacterium]